jgi:hypothetical protein
MSTQLRVILLLLQVVAIVVGIVLGVAFWNGVS